MDPPPGGGIHDGSLGGNEPRLGEFCPSSGVGQVEPISQLDMHPAADAAALWADHEFWIDGTQELGLLRSNSMNEFHTNTVVDGNGFSGYGQPQADVGDNGFTSYNQIRTDVGDNGLSGFTQLQTVAVAVAVAAASDTNTPSTARLERSPRATKWTKEMDMFFMDRKTYGDTLAVIAGKIQAQFGVDVNPNMLSKRFKLLVNRISKMTRVQTALTNSMPRIISFVQQYIDESKRLSPEISNMTRDKIDKELMRRLPECLDNAVSEILPQIFQSQGVEPNMLDSLDY